MHTSVFNLLFSNYAVKNDFIILMFASDKFFNVYNNFIYNNIIINSIFVGLNFLNLKSKNLSKIFKKLDNLKINIFSFFVFFTLNIFINIQFLIFNFSSLFYKLNKCQV
jgi:hypothetical protein